MQSRIPSRRAAGAHYRISFVAIAAALLAGGCSVGTSGPSRVAGPAIPIAGEPAPFPDRSLQVAKVEDQADGLPAPSVLRSPSEDPRAPWGSGSGAGNRLVAVAASEPWPVLKVIPRPADPDDVIRRAIAEHEMRQR